MVDLKNPTPKLFCSESKTFTVTKTGVVEVVDKFVEKYAKSPASYESTLEPFSVVVFTSLTVKSGIGAAICISIFSSRS